MKKSLARTSGANPEDQLDFEVGVQAHCVATEAVREGLAAVREKRSPRFQGE